MTVNLLRHDRTVTSRTAGNARVTSHKASPHSILQRSKHRTTLCCCRGSMRKNGYLGVLIMGFKKGSLSRLQSKKRKADGEK